MWFVSESCPHWHHISSNLSVFSDSSRHQISRVLVRGLPQQEAQAGKREEHLWSDTRLAIHNLPKAVDKKMREIAREGAADTKAKIDIILCINCCDLYQKAVPIDTTVLSICLFSVIRPGTKSAEGLSEAYLNKRLKLENVKKEKLKNLSIFVSGTPLGRP